MGLRHSIFILDWTRIKLAHLRPASLVYIESVSFGEAIWQSDGDDSTGFVAHKPMNVLQFMVIVIQNVVDSTRNNQGLDKGDAEESEETRHLFRAGYRISVAYFPMAAA
ncbi:hypothetical protein Fot_27599 [Forsythia ovata]|uniref:Uncharacterized protein n=1 Tax=Forsythia ovata TaxID=205694 RepID=A0ABD1TLM1_9LAMI